METVPAFPELIPVDKSGKFEQIVVKNRVVVLRKYPLKPTHNPLKNVDTQGITEYPQYEAVTYESQLFEL